jgi:tRNA (guanine37-N1)-methyltransferase
MFEIHILSLFPESVKPYLDTSIMWRAQEKGLFRYHVHNLTDWTVRSTRRVDDRPYGGWAGTILTIEPLVWAIRSIEESFGKMDTIIYFSPRGTIHDQKMAEWYSSHPGKYLILCGHYEGIDERIFDFFSVVEISIGNYVLSSGELASLVWIDSIVRLLPWVISSESLHEESFSVSIERKKEYPQYSRPEVFEGKEVPKILLSWDPKKIREWNHGHTSE